MDQTQHTTTASDGISELPWHAESLDGVYQCIVAADGYTVAALVDYQDAIYILRAVNYYRDALNAYALAEQLRNEAAQIRQMIKQAINCLGRFFAIHEQEGRFDLEQIERVYVVLIFALVHHCNGDSSSEQMSSPSPASGDTRSEEAA